MIAETIPLGELTKVQTGKLDANASSENGEYPFFTCAREPLKIDRWKYDLDAVLVAGNGDLNVKHYRGKFEAYQRTYIINSLDDQRLDTRYLFHFLDKYVEKLREQSIGGIIKYIKLGMLTGAEIPLPPLEEQRRIAAILDQADALRRLRRRALDRLNTLGQAIFHEMFGDAVNPQQLKQSQTVQDALNAGHLTAIQDGNHGERHPKVADFSDEGTPFIMANCFGDGRLHLEAAYRLSNHWLDYLRKGFAKGGDVLLTHKGTLGETAVVDQAVEVLILSPQVTYYRTGDGLLPDYLQLFFRTSAFQAVLKKGGDQSTRAYIGLNRQKELPIFIPPISEQKELVRRIKNLRPINESSTNSDAYLEDLFASLQHRAFRGEL